MTKRQVLALLGTPAIQSPFDHDRWDYLMTTYVRGKKTEEHKLTLFFEYGALARTEGKYYGQSATERAAAPGAGQEVPYRGARPRARGATRTTTAIPAVATATAAEPQALPRSARNLRACIGSMRSGR